MRAWFHGTNSKKRGLLWSMVAECSQDSSGMQSCCGVGGLIGQVEIGDLGRIVIKKQDIAGPDITMNNRWLNLFVQIFQPLGCTKRNFNSLVPIKCWTRFSPLYPFSSCIKIQPNKKCDSLVKKTNTN